MPRGRPALVIAGAIVAALIAVVAWRCRGGADEHAAARDARHGEIAPTPRRDPPARGSLAGTVRDDQGAPIANARVCVERVADDAADDRRCVATDARGGYVVGELEAATHEVFASAPRRAPASAAVALAAGQRATGVDLVLAPGGVALVGTVVDIGGGPIAGARVWTTRGGDGETDASGRYALWVGAGPVVVFARADGYATEREAGLAPSTIDLQLTPESTIAGTVVDASTRQPRPGVRVAALAAEPARYARTHEAITDDHGRFRIARVVPGRYAIEATHAEGFGRSFGSVLVGLGQHVDGVAIELHRAVRIAARIHTPDGTPCEAARFAIRRDAQRLESDARSHAIGDRHAIDGVRPGRYYVRVRCPDHVELEPPPIVVGDRDVEVTWTVERGAALRGHVRTRAGVAVADAVVVAKLTNTNARTLSVTARTDASGAYVAAGLVPGWYDVAVASRAGMARAQTFQVGTGTVERDLVIDAGGAIAGVVVDERGTPVARVEVGVACDHHVADPDPTWTADDGTFRVEGVPAGRCRVFARRGWADELRRPGTDASALQGAYVTVELDRVANVRLVVEAETGAIRGSVTDERGGPVGDAWVVAAREGHAAANPAGVYWNLEARPALTSSTGAFELRGLAPGTYTVRAFRKGGGDAVRQGVQVGSTVELQLGKTASIAGTVTLRGAPPVELAVTVRGFGVHRVERFHGSGGRYEIRDLRVAGVQRFDLAFDAITGLGERRQIALRPGERATVDVALDPVVTLTGTLVELGTNKPVPDIRVFAVRKGSREPIGFVDRLAPNVSDANGRFAIDRAPIGSVVILGQPRVLAHWHLATLREIAASATGTVELGAIAMVPPRVVYGRPIGRLGVRFETGDTEHVAEYHRVAWIDPAGPAAGTALRVGDVIATVDGVDVTGPNTGHFDALVKAPPGTAIVLGTAAGSSVTVVLAAP